MIPGIIPVGVTTPAFAYKEGFAGTMSNLGVVNIALTTPQTIYRYIVVSAAGGQSSTATTASINIFINGTLSTDFSYSQNTDPSGSSSSISIAYFKISGADNFDLSLSNSLGFSMSYTVAVFEIPASNLNAAASGGTSGSSPRFFGIPIYVGGLVIATQFGQGGSGTWADMTYAFMTKVPVSQSAQQSMAFLYPPVTGTLSTLLSNNAASNRAYAAITFNPT